MTKFLVRTVYLLRLLATPLLIFKKSTSNSYINLALLCCILSFLLSCNKNDSFGVEIQPENQNIYGQYVDTLFLATSTILSDSIKTDELNGVSPLGTYVDPIFGKTQASIFTQIRLAQAYDFRPENNGSLDSLIIDSIVLYLALDGSYGDLNPQIFEVYQLDSTIIKDSSYYSNSQISEQSIDLTNALSLETNPLIPGSFAGQLVDEAILRIPLNIINFGLPIINESGNSSLEGNDEENQFLDWFKGIKITTSGNEDGGLYYVDLMSNYTKICLYYRDTSGALADHDTIRFDFNINSNCSYFHQVIHDFSGTEIENNISNNLGQDAFYIQCLGGVNGALSIPSIENLVDSSVIINKAEIVLPYQYYNYDIHTPPSNLFLTRKNEEGSAQFLPDFFESNPGGTANNLSKEYRFNITRHVNEILAGEINNDTLKIIPSGAGISANRVVLNGMQSSKKDKAKLLLTYTKY
jgi:hypothetical protein